MSEPKTPILGLNKIDRSSPSTTYFDLDKYLDQNWEKVDNFVEQVEEKVGETAAKVSGIQERLDTEKRRSVTLEPGLQIVNAERASPFKLEGLKGRMLVNLLGRRGNGESLSGLPVATNSAIIALDSTTKDLGTSSFKITATGLESTEHYVDLAILDVLVGACYVLVAMAKPNAKANGRLMTYGIVDESPSDFFPESNLANATDRYTPVFLRFNPVTANKVMVRLQVPNSSGNALYVSGGQEVNYDSIRLYRVTPDEYRALSNMTPEQVNAKYPSVNSVQPVRSPYAIRYGENLLPPLYEATYLTAASKAIANGQYGVTFQAGGDYDFIAFRIPVIPNTDYTFSYEHEGYTSSTNEGAGWSAVNANYNGGITGYSYDKVKTFNVGNRSEIAIVIRSFDSSKAVSCKNWMLNIGTTAKPFKPREDAMLALQTDLYADSVTGANADEVFEKDGHYFKLAKWKSVVMDGSLGWRFSSSQTGWKSISSDIVGVTVQPNSSAVTKYNGNLLKFVDGNASAVSDSFDWGNANGVFYLTVPAADSGWGDSYTPTADEIKAYFLGWKMYTFAQPVDGIYPGTGTKAWVEIPWKDKNSDVNIPQHVSYTLPTTQAPNYTPYQLVYQLATPTVEPIMSEGQLTLIEGSNQVEVGTGIVLWEKATPRINVVGDYYTINTAGGDAITALNNKVDRFIGVFRDSKMDPRWIDNTYQPYGNVRKIIPTADFGPLADYSVTYLMLDTFPISPFEGSYATNEKALLIDMNDSLRQNAAAVSVVEKALIDAIQQLNQLQKSKSNVWGPII